MTMDVAWWKVVREHTMQEDIVRDTTRYGGRHNVISNGILDSGRLKAKHDPSAQDL